MSIEARFNGGAYGRVETASTPASFSYVDQYGIPKEMRRQFETEIASEIEKWTQSLSTVNEGSYDLFNRSRWEKERHTFAIMSKCAWAIENEEVLSTLADVTEALMFNKCSFGVKSDPDQEDIWNQWAADVDLDSRLREIARETFKVSQVYVGLFWEERSYKVRDDRIQDILREFKQDILAKRADALRQMQMPGQEVPEPQVPAEPKGPGRGNRTRKKTYDLVVPTAFTIFDPTKVLPVGSMVFGRERFAYIASSAEATEFDRALTGEINDPTVRQMIVGRYTPTEADIQTCGELGIDSRNLFLFRESALFRFNLTKSNYERFAPIRLKSILPILEMKDHLRNSDRASLIGNTNFIVVIRKGTDKLPAHPAEIENLQDQARVIARLPVLVGDHRLSVDIVAPPLDNTLIESRWQVLDSRLVFRALGTFTPLVQGGNSSGSGVSEMSRIVARGLENRRHMLVRALERHVFSLIMEVNDDLKEAPALEFNPRRISLDVDQDIVQAILKLRDRGDISRETTLEELDFDQDVELVRRAREKVRYDEVFQSQTPYGSPQTNPYNPQLQQAPQQSPEQSPPEGGRPPGVKEDEPRNGKGDVKA
jgi:hypothetical protein